MLSTAAMAAEPVLHPLSQKPHPLREKVMEMKQRPEFEAYAGWLDLLLHQAEWKQTSESRKRLEEWVERLENGEDPLPSTRGTIEWAHLSHVDGRGQPLVIMIPDDYDPSKSWPLQVYLHGYGGYTKPSVFEREDHSDPYLQIWPYGRTLGGGYTGLSEVDVREAIEYTKQHWNIDEDRVHLMGGSMGAWGVMDIASRHPDWFASARPMAGASNDWPLGNFLNLPVLAVHGGFDDIVPQVLMQPGIMKLADMGGPATFFSDDRHGHAARLSEPTNTNFERIALKQRRRLDVQHIDYTAVDGMATGAYWAHIEEWGPEGKPARINLRLTLDNTLFATFENVSTVKLDLTMAPVDRDADLEILIPQQQAMTCPAPLPDTLYLMRSSLGPSGANWTFRKTAPPKPDFRLHTPGGLKLLYNGEPLLIVYGTMAWKDRNAALKLAAELSSLSARGDWGGQGQTRDGWPVDQMTYGKFPVKADHEVTEEDIQNNNLILLGDPRHNSLIQRIQKDIPVRMTLTRIRTEDGLSWSTRGAAMGILHYNPLAPQRLIYWIVCNRTEDYAPSADSAKATLMGLQSTAAPDFVIVDASSSELIAARRFDSRWRWEADYADSPVFPEDMAVLGPRAEILAEAHRLAVGTDFGMTREGEWGAFDLFARAGVTRLADVETVLSDMKAAKITMSGLDLLKLHEVTVNGPGASRGWSHMEAPQIGMLVPAPDPDKIDINAPYTISLHSKQVFLMTIFTKADTRNYELTDVTFRDAWNEYAPVLIR